MRSRADLLGELLRLERPVGEIVRELASFGWDSHEELVVLTLAHLRAVLGRFIAGILSAEEASAWAESIEGRDDIGLQQGFENSLKQILFELANPDISDELTQQRAEVLIVISNEEWPVYSDHAFTLNPSGSDPDSYTKSAATIDTTDWSLLRHASGSCEHVPDALRELTSDDELIRDAAYWKLDNYVVVQGDLFTRVNNATIGCPPRTRGDWHADPRLRRSARGAASPRPALAGRRPVLA